MPIKFKLSSPPQQVNLSRQSWFIPYLFIIARLMFFLGMVSSNLTGFGDVPRYFEVAALKGWPYFSYWMEYPPLFSFISTFIYQQVGGIQVAYEAAMYALFTIAGAAALWAFQKLDRITFPAETDMPLRSWVYLIFLLVIPYSWWYFEMLPVCMMLLALYYTLNNKPLSSALWIGTGILTKWFPGLILPALWRTQTRKKAVLITSVSLGLTLIIYLVLWLYSPAMTQTSLLSQPSRNSWQTVWAWIDGNFMNGAFATPEDRYNPAYINDVQIGYPPVIPPVLRLVVFGAIGLFFWYKTKSTAPISVLSLSGITWALFLLWSSGWSPQWILYLIPLLLLTLPVQQGLFLNLILSLLTLIEWPTLLGHRLFFFMGPIALLRSLLLIYFIFLWHRLISNSE